MEQLFTVWGEKLDRYNVLGEYPRPSLRREGWVCLNGLWDYVFTKRGKRPVKDASGNICWDGKILVPFSPEAALSGVGRQLMPDETLWYRRELPAGRAEAGTRILMNFGAVDTACRLLINGREAARHTGGYWPFSADITDFLKDSGNEAVLEVRDASDKGFYARGKQKLERGGMFYTATSGIWQTVWLEAVPENHIENVSADADADSGRVSFSIETAKKAHARVRIYEPAVMGYELSFGEIIAECTGVTDGKLTAFLEEPALWEPDSPFLYPYEIDCGEDTVSGYFAFRSFTVEPDRKGCLRFCLNHRPLFLRGVLDQGYWPDGLMTPPSDEAFVFDIEGAKKAGFNMIRKHIKIEPARWYWHCDRLGMIVWQDMVCGGGKYKMWYVAHLATLLSSLRAKPGDGARLLLARTSARGRRCFEWEMKETVRCLKNHPSIAAWVLFNEGWGQFDTKHLTEELKGLDPTRPVDSASGWFDVGSGDFESVHHYYLKLPKKTDPYRAYVLSEFGGYSWRVPGHCAFENEYGYRKYSSRRELNDAYKKLIEEREKLVPSGLSGYVYTQLSDVEEETNGVFTWDRKVTKLDPIEGKLPEVRG